LTLRAVRYDLGQALQHLEQADPRFARWIHRVGPCAIQLRALEPFEGLLGSILHQQLAGAAAAKIQARFLDLFADQKRRPTPARLLELPDDALRGAGLSRNKLAAMRDLAIRAAQGEVPRRSVLLRWPEERIVERLTAVRGIGRWTVEMLLIFNLGFPDVLPLDDYGVRQGFVRAFGGDLADRKRLVGRMVRRGERWRPYRSVASWYLWRIAELDRGAREAAEKST
jgi:3-methyladenine DNA glycosylase/8-oxoguanine DNA glycosylase